MYIIIHVIILFKSTYSAFCEIQLNLQFSFIEESLIFFSEYEMYYVKLLKAINMFLIEYVFIDTFSTIYNRFLPDIEYTPCVNIESNIKFISYYKNGFSFKIISAG